MRGSDAAQPGYEQPNWHAETVINAGAVHLPGSSGQPLGGAPEGVPPPPPDAAGFRRSLARLLLRKLTSTLDEMHWLDDKLVELSAIVEDVDGRTVTSRRRGPLRWRERSAVRPLPQVLAHPETDLILLQGGAGAGKSVALRQHAMAQLEEIAEGRAPEGPLPLYVNLRELRAKPHEINTDVLRRYIMAQTGPRGSSAVATYFAHCFTEDLQQRRVTLLLDSFDEIPAVLDSPTIDAAVAPYIQTVIELVEGGGRCVVAAREYKGPRASGWTRLQLLGMDPEQQEEFLRRLGFEEPDFARVQALLTDPRRGFATELRNPLSLHLLATYVREMDAVPDRPSALFEEYAASRLRKALPSAVGLDGREPSGRAGGLQRRIEDFLARFAFQLTRTRGGLSVDERTFRDEITRDAGDPATHDLMIRVLEESRILVSSPEEPMGSESGAGSAEQSGRRVFFGHRRVLQHFASRYVAEHPSAVPPRELATSGQWRETAVTVLQDGTAEVTDPLLEALSEALADERNQADRADAEEFTWSPGAVHTLELLTAAYQSRPELPHAPVRMLVEDLVARAWKHGSISDRKFALDCIPLLSEGMRQSYVEAAFAGKSNWLRMTALRDCAMLPEVPETVRRAVRRLLVTRLGEKKTTPSETRAFDGDLRRLRVDEDLVALRRLVDLAPKGVVFWGAFSALFLAFSDTSRLVNMLTGLLMSSGLFLGTSWILFWCVQASEPLSYGARRRRIHRFLEQGGLRVTRIHLGWLVVCIALGTGAMCVLALGILGLLFARTYWLVWAPVWVLLTFYTILWGPSLLYAVRRASPSWRFSVTRVVLVVPYVLMSKNDLVRRLLKKRPSLREVLASMAILPALGLAVGIGDALTRVRLSPRALQVLIAITACALAYMFARPFYRELRRHRALNRAIAHGSPGGPAFFTSLFGLRDAKEASDYVSRIRTVPRGAPLDLDRQTLRRCIALLQDDSPAESVPGISPEALAQLTKWRDDSRLLDELGRLDEQLRTR
ncbi:NACHT domain-containing protein [Streptomyces sp. W16]|uniref:NACHT domain-containing protein n=1 Tax=Streptomyces sp. W16 TaxID=3076631 RepID=UPI00295B69F6|nr:NACHT domain-containing protein [Streptomyces sp. W16]MDV9172952.1 NACHT domain-containing protein [Streptomyces sp. W16]